MSISVETRRKLIKITQTIVFLIGVVVFLYIGQALTSQPELKIDTLGFTWVENISESISSTVMYYITMAGSPFILRLVGIFIGLLFMFVKKDLFASLFIIIVPTVESLINRGLKLIFQRERPLINPGVEGTGFSFPSGHATGSIVFYGCLIYLTFRGQINSNLKWTLTAGFSLLILLIGISRVYFNVHYPSDVIAGYCIGLSFLMLSIVTFEFIFAFLERRRENYSSPK